MKLMEKKHETSRENFTTRRSKRNIFSDKVVMEESALSPTNFSKEIDATCVHGGLRLGKRRGLTVILIDRDICLQHVRIQNGGRWSWDVVCLHRDSRCQLDRDQPGKQRHGDIAIFCRGNTFQPDTLCRLSKHPSTDHEANYNKDDGGHLKRPTWRGNPLSCPVRGW